MIDETSSTSHLITRSDFDRARKKISTLYDLQTAVNQKMMRVYEHENRLIRAQIEGDDRAVQEITTTSALELQSAIGILRDQSALVIDETTPLASQAYEIRLGIEVLQARVAMLQEGQFLIYRELSRVRQELLEAYDEGNRDVIRSMVDVLQETQLQTLQAILQAIDSCELANYAEIQDSLSVLETILAALQSGQTSLLDQHLSLRDQLLQVDDALKNEASIDHKLKLVVPLLFLQYELEFAIGSKADLTKALGSLWDKINSRLRG